MDGILELIDRGQAKFDDEFYSAIKGLADTSGSFKENASGWNTILDHLGSIIDAKLYEQQGTDFGFLIKMSHILSRFKSESGLDPDKLKRVSILY